MNVSPTQTVLAELESVIQYRFTDRALLEQALTHRSYGRNHYERLEFLGDSILNAVVAEALYQAFPDLPEGDLSRLRANLVCQEQLVSVADELKLSRYLRLGEGELKSGGQHRPSILADTVESLYGALWRDGGFAAAQQVILSAFASRIAAIDLSRLPSAKDAKTRLQEWLQGRRCALPTYESPNITGAAHAQTFEVLCRVPDFSVEGRGSGVTRRAAEQQAAEQVLQQLEALPTKGKQRGGA
ncbi:MAG: ribonuclease III [Fluviibacter sp.]